LLETIRQYAHEKLVESGGTENVRNRHLEYYRELTEKVEFNFHGPEYTATGEHLETELDNIRLALGWCLEGKRTPSWNPEPGLRLASALGDYWYFCGRLAEGFQWLERLLVSESEQRGPQPISTQRAKWCAKALQAAGYLAIWLRDYDKALRMSEESRDLYRELGFEGRRGYALALLNLAWLASGGNYEIPMEALLSEASDIFKEVGDPIRENDCRLCRAMTALLHNDHELARSLLEEDLIFRNKIGDQEEAANTLQWLGQIAFSQNDWEQANILFEESRGLFLQVKSKYYYFFFLLSLGGIECSQGKYDQAAQYYLTALDLARKQGEITAIQSSVYSLGYLALIQGNYARAAEMFEQNLEIMRKYEHSTLVAFCLGDLGSLAWEKGDYKSAEQKFDEKLSLLRKLGSNEFEADALFGAGRAAFAQGDYDRARIFFNSALALQQVTLPRNIPVNLEALAYAEAVQGKYVLAAHLLGATQAWQQKNQYSRTPKEHEMRKNAIASLQQTLGEDAFAAAWEEGMAMTLGQAISYAKEDVKAGDISTHND
jgi:tetratricopeptide (TPR) repeat protein